MLAWDGSENAGAAYAVAADVARRYGAELVAVSITHAPEHAELAGEKERALDEARKFYARKLEPLIQEAERSGLAIRHEVIAGDHPAEGLLQHARDAAFDLVVIGRRGMGRTSWFRMGSVTDRISRYAPCPVMVVGQAD